MNEEKETIITENSEKNQSAKSLQNYPRASLALGVAIVALGLSLYNFFEKPRAVIDTPEAFIQQMAENSGVKAKKYKQCIADPSIVSMVTNDISELESIATFANMNGVGTPFNLIITDKQVIPLNGAYPYDAFEFLINDIQTNGVASAETLKTLETAEIDYSVTNMLRPFNPEIDHYRGTENPKITLIEYSDFECPFCARVHGTLQDLVNNYPELTWVYRDYPLVSIHDQAMISAISAECIARESGNTAFWDFADAIFKNQNKLQ